MNLFPNTGLPKMKYVDFNVCARKSMATRSREEIAATESTDIQERFMPTSAMFTARLLGPLS